MESEGRARSLQNASKPSGGHGGREFLLVEVEGVRRGLGGVLSARASAWFSTCTRAASLRPGRPKQGASAPPPAMPWMAQLFRCMDLKGTSGTLVMSKLDSLHPPPLAKLQCHSVPLPSPAFAAAVFACNTSPPPRKPNPAVQLKVSETRGTGDRGVPAALPEIRTSTSRVMVHDATRPPALTDRHSPLPPPPPHRYWQTQIRPSSRPRL